MDTKFQNNCCGCLGCLDACPVNAISIRKGTDSFCYPQIDPSECIGCGRCEEVCPLRNAPVLANPQACFSGVIRDEDGFRRSSSGGAFEAILRSVLEENEGRRCFVAGAVWDREFKVVHRLAEISSAADILPFQKSKYVQSKTNGIYHAVAKALETRDGLVLFSGTPCQVAALLNVLGGHPDNLITIDLICRGSPSQSFFDKYRKELEDGYHSGLSAYSFRNKEILDNGTLFSKSSKYAFENGKTFLVTRHNDPFLKCFYLKTDLLLREACVGCAFKTEKRVGDFTIGDSWGIEQLYPEISGFRGISAVTFNSDAAVKYKDAVAAKMIVYETPYAFIVEHNGGLRSGNAIPPEQKAKRSLMWKGLADEAVTFCEAVNHLFSID